jgi:hypothetical protein
MGNASLRPVCFMVMPFGKKDTGLASGQGPMQVNFDSLWQKALAPALDKLGYTAIRADQDTGSLIVQEMLERLTLADLVVADLSIPNGNVYYEVGMRHATKADGCVLIAADWARPLFDAAQMRRIAYPLPEMEVSDAQALAIRATLEPAIDKMRTSLTPPFCLEGFPNLKAERATAFRDFVQRLSQFQAEVTAARKAPQAERGDRVRKLLQSQFPDDGQDRPILPGVAIELLYLVRDTLPWRETVRFIERLPEPIRNLPTVQEQYCLARSKAGMHVDAIGALEALVALRGDSSERQGLLGGRYKKLYLEAADGPDKLRYLSAAIDHYERAMLLDLNDYYPSSNLPRLLKARNAPGDAARAIPVAHLAEIACERAFRRNPRDEWIKPTRLAAAVDEEEVQKAQTLVGQIAQEGAVTWKIESVLNDLKLSVQLVRDAAKKEHLQALIMQLEQMLSPP